MSEPSSCRPKRLLRFEETTGSIADGLTRRIGKLDAAVGRYLDGCEPDYTVDCHEAPGAARESASGLREFGRWTGDIARGFVIADAGGRYLPGLARTDPEHVLTQDEHDVVEAMPGRRRDPYLGVPAARSGDDDPVSSSDDGPPAWLSHLSHAATRLDIESRLVGVFAKLERLTPSTTTVTTTVRESTIVVFADGSLVARFTELQVAEQLARPHLATGLSATSKWLSRASNVLTFVVAFGQQYDHDRHRSMPDRLARATVRGTADATAVWAAGLYGGQAGLACGPLAVVCSPVAAGLAAFAAYLFADGIANWALNGRDRKPRPGEHDQDELEDALADPDDEQGAPAADLAAIDLLARDIAISEAKTDPTLRGYMGRVVPDRAGLLERMHPVEVPRPKRRIPKGTPGLDLLYPPEVPAA